MVSSWKRPVSLEDMVLRDDGWKPIYTQFTTWETYKRDYPLYIFFNTFYGDVYEKAYKNCFIEFLIKVLNYELAPSLIGVFTRLNVMDGYYWKHRIPVNLTFPEACVKEIDATYDELVMELGKAGVLEELERLDSEEIRTGASGGRR